MLSTLDFLIMMLQLPYGTMTDDEMKAMPIPTLQDEGLLFLWVTGRAMEIGRECLRVWGYTRVDEVVWVKTNQVHIFSPVQTLRS
jgi:mRNA (2'-O-methyladenosine-N6-)-methyltransferase